ncbi:hypothetical protein ES705_51090 [subsurface metagenome]
MVVTNVPDYYIDEVVVHTVISLALTLIRIIQTYSELPKQENGAGKKLMERFIDQLIQLALERHQDKKQNKISYDESKLLDK